MRSAFAVVVVLACSSHEAPASSPSPAKSESTSAAALTGHPWVGLVVPNNPVEPLAFALPEAALAELGVKSHRSFTATQPRIWLLVFEFADQAALLAAEPRLLEQLGDAAPYARKSSYTGAWLLVTGFPSDEPVSVEMEFARGAFLGRWAGEE